jgi:beta-lactamase class D
MVPISKPHRKRKKTIAGFAAALAVFIALPVQAAAWLEFREAGRLFENTGVSGTFVMYDAATGIFGGHNEVRANRRFVPASTFKIPNTLIGLSLGAVKSVDDPLPYTGPAEPFIKAWDRDMGLREALALSNVPIYQELARRIGLGRMRELVAALDYGNGEIGTSVNDFWLKGPLQISAVEQTQLLARLALGTLPVPSAAQRSVREIVLWERGPGWTLYGNPDVAKAEGAADPRRQGRSCIRIPRALENEGDAAPHGFPGG